MDYTEKSGKLDMVIHTILNLTLFMMKRTYQVPESEAFEMILEGEILLSGGKAGEPGRPGGDLDDIYEYEDLL